MKSTSYYKKIEKDYSHKKLQNPFFRKRTKGKSSWWRRSLVSAGAGVVIFLLWFLTFSSFWTIKNIEITGLSRTPQGGLEQLIREQSAQKRYLVLNQSNLLFFDGQRATKQIMGAYNFSDLKINKSWPRTLVVTATERPLIFIFQEGSGKYYSSNDGYLVAPESAGVNPDNNAYFLVENQSGASLINDHNKLKLTPEYLNLLLSLHQRLAAYPELPLEKFILDQKLNTLSAKITNGPVVYFSTKTDQSDQLSHLLLVKKEKIKDNFSKTSYIDLRYSGQVIIYPDFK